MSPAAQRNKGPIAEILKQYLLQPESPEQKPFRVLEVASGSGVHVCHFGALFPHVTWQPSELEPAMVQISGAGKNVLDPLEIDISRPLSDKIASSTFDLVLNVNMTHISPFSCTEGLFSAAGQVLLAPEGRLVVYGPYSEDGVLCPESNVNFDQMLRSQNPDWGIRDRAQLVSEGQNNGLELEAIHEMPANNKMYVFTKVS